MEWVAKVGTAGHFQFPSSPDQERKWCQLSMQMLMLIVGWRKFQTCVPAQSCSTEMSSVEIGWIWISTTMLMMIRRILTMHYNCLGHARAFQKAFGKKNSFCLFGEKSTDLSLFKSPLSSPVINNFVNQSWISWAERQLAAIPKTSHVLTKETS